MDVNHLVERLSDFEDDRWRIRRDIPKLSGVLDSGGFFSGMKAAMKRSSFNSEFEDVISRARSLFRRYSRVEEEFLQKFPSAAWHKIAVDISRVRVYRDTDDEDWFDETADARDDLLDALDDLETAIERNTELLSSGAYLQQPDDGMPEKFEV